MARLLQFRLLALVAVNGLIALHVVLYYAFGHREIGCVDFFGLATFFGNGQVTAGTVFLGILILSTIILGRVFCGWGCHFALFQDLLVRLTNRLGLTLPFRRSRLELILPPILFVVTLLYPILAWWREHGVPREIAVDVGSPEVWHLLPGIKGVVLIFLVDVVVLTLLFGSRAFCRYVCPYGFFLKIFHMASPLRIVKSGDCSGCGSCAKACPTGVPIKYEIQTFAAIHDLNCVNCGDCVVACPDEALSFGFTRKAYSHSFERIVTGSSQPIWAEAILLATALGGLFLYRGREYGDFLSVAMGIGVGAFVVIGVQPSRFVRARWVRHVSIRTVRLAAITLASYFALGMVGEGLGLISLGRVQSSLAAKDYQVLFGSASRGRGLHRVFQPFTFYLDDFDDRAGRYVGGITEDADRAMRSERWRDAELLYRSVLALEPRSMQATGNLGTALLEQGKFWEAAQCYLRVLDHDPNDMVALYHLAMSWIQLGELDQAANVAQRILSSDTVGNAYYLMKQNPLFELLKADPGYRRAMSAYRPQRDTNPLETRGKSK